MVEAFIVDSLKHVNKYVQGEILVFVCHSIDSMTEKKLNQSQLKWLATYGAIGFSAVFLTNWPSYHFQILGGPIPLLYYFAFTALVIPLVWLRPDTLRRFMGEASLLWFVIYVISGLLWLMIAQGYLEEENRQFRLRFLSFFFFCTGLIITAEAEHKKVVFAILACALVATITYWLDFMFPFNFVPAGFPGSNPGRAAGLFINANAAAYALILMCVAVMPFTPIHFRIVVLMMMLSGVVPTLSRSGIMLTLAVVLMWIYFKQFDRRQLFISALIAPIFISIGIGLFQFGFDAENVNVTNITERLDFFSSAGDEIYDYSSEERIYVARLAWEMFLDNPLMGSGIGATSTWAAAGSTHNMYLYFLAEQGLFGGILFLALIIIILGRGIGLLKHGAGKPDRDVGLALTIFGIYYVFIGFFSHNLLDDPSTLFLMAFLFTAERKSVNTARRGSNGVGYVIT